MLAFATRPVVVLLVAACVLVAPAAVANSAPARATSPTAELERGVLREINTLRARHGLAPLRFSTALGAAARGHSRAMAAQGFFSHESADGSPFWKRVRKHYAPRSRGSWTVGENLLWSSPSLTPDEALRWWLGSPPHRKNLLRASWREIGLSAVHVASAPGVYEGAEVTILTADFGAR
jgi:uncharacterized protein YkwD